MVFFFCYCYCLVSYSAALTSHILTPKELKVLAKLLQAFEEDKIRELTQSIDNKEKKNVSLEQVELLLQQSGKVEAASRLKEDLTKGNTI